MFKKKLFIGYATKCTILFKHFKENVLSWWHTYI